MPELSPIVIPLCSSHELRWDFRDVLLRAAPAAPAAGATVCWEELPAGTVESLWSRNRSPTAGDVASRVAHGRDARAVVLVARSAIEEVTAELPAADALGANLRRLSRGDVLQSPGCLLLALDDRCHPCVGWVGDWTETAPLFERLARLADQTLPVLIRGETGTGKEMIARAVHVLGRRRDQPFLAINCAELPDSILESELFGHSRGAFTGAVGDRPGLFEAAGDGTVFLDEVGELPQPAQAKLLRLLEERRVRRLGSSQSRALACRIVAATNRDLPKEIERGRFRADLFYRLRGSELVLRALRERQGDVLTLAELFAARAALRFGRFPVQLGEDAKLVLAAHDWPGNIRELRQAIEVCVLSASTERISSRDLGLLPASDAQAPAVEPLLTASAVERAHILRALASTAGNKMAAARILGLTRQSLHRRMLRHGISLGAGIVRPVTGVCSETVARGPRPPWCGREGG